MISLFKEKSPVSVFWLIIVCFGLHLHSLTDPPKIVTSPSDGFIYFLLHPFQNADVYSTSLVYVLIIFLLALQLNFMLSSLRMFPKPSYTPALAFIIFSALIPAFNVINAALLACILVIWILYSACRLYAAPNSKTSIYNFGLLCGLCVILYFPSVPLIIIAFIALAIIRPFHINEWFVLFFGMITPAYFLAGYLFLTDQFNLVPVPQQLFDVIKLPLQPLLIIISLITASLATVWGIFWVQSSATNVLIQVRKGWSVFLVSLLFITPVAFFMKDAFPAVLLLAAIPAACYTGFAFANSRNILPVVFFWVLIGLSIYNNWFAKY
ncbi:MAG: hypothetical protein ABJB05_08240 [Parafilimonas sp.]